MKTKVPLSEIIETLDLLIRDTELLLESHNWADDEHSVNAQMEALVSVREYILENAD